MKKNIIKTFFLGYTTIEETIHLIILQTLWERYFLMFSEQSERSFDECSITVTGKNVFKTSRKHFQNVSGVHIIDVEVQLITHE